MSDHLLAMQHRATNEYTLLRVGDVKKLERGHDLNCTDTYTFTDGSRLEVNKWGHRKVRAANSDRCLWSN